MEFVAIAGSHWVNELDVQSRRGFKTSELHPVLERIRFSLKGLSSVRA